MLLVMSIQIKFILRANDGDWPKAQRREALKHRREESGEGAASPFWGFGVRELSWKIFEILKSYMQICTFWCFSGIVFVGQQCWANILEGQKILSPQYFLLGAISVAGSMPLYAVHQKLGSQTKITNSGSLDQKSQRKRSRHCVNQEQYLNS